MKKSIFLLLAIVSVAGMIAISGCNKKETYMVYFNSNGGSGIMEPQAFTEGEEQALSKNLFTREGFTFNGWIGNGSKYNDGQVITVSSDVTLFAMWLSGGASGTGGDPSSSGTSGTVDGHNWVDLGLPSGTKWATCNIGATNPEDYGNYYSWGETTIKDGYSGDSYTYSSNPTTLPASADAATANWGSGWRMPTEEEFNELKNNSTVTWTNQNGVIGCLFAGANGNSIFLPAAGCCGSNLFDAGSRGHYWSSSIWTADQSHAVSFYFYSGNHTTSNYNRSNGMTIRPVCAQ